MVEIGLLQGLLFDLDGVFHVGNSKVAGSEDVIAYLNSKHLPYRYVTNTTTQSRIALAAKMQALGLPIQADESSPHLTLPDFICANITTNHAICCYPTRLYRSLPSSMLTISRRKQW